MLDLIVGVVITQKLNETRQYRCQTNRKVSNEGILSLSTATEIYECKYIEYSWLVKDLTVVGFVFVYFTIAICI